MQRLDSPLSTAFHKWLIYIFLLFMWGLTIKAYAEGNHRIDLMHYILPPVSVVALWWFSSFKQVTLDGDTLIIRGFSREARVPVSQIDRIGKHRGYRDPDFISIVFKTKTEFGRRVRIMTGISSNRELDRIAKILQRAMGGKEVGVKIIRTPLKPGITPKTANGKEVVVRGWTNEELSGILTDFADAYDKDLGHDFDYEVQPHDNGSIRVTFPHNIRAQEFSFLINYVQYPKNYDPKGRSISVVGEALITPDFNPPSKDLVGQNATFYIPPNDQKYDLVYIRVGDEIFENSFAARHWKRVTDSRVPPDVGIKQ
jgi:hypothetical protein